jgi:hypothetical protein
VRTAASKERRLSEDADPSFDNLLTGQMLGWTLSNDCVLAKDISLTPEWVIMRQEPTVIIKKAEFDTIFQMKSICITHAYRTT